MSVEMRPDPGWDAFWGSRPDAVPIRLSPRYERAFSLLDRYVSPGMVVADAGCGSGLYSRYFIGKGCPTYCLDYSNKALELTRRNTMGKAEKYLEWDLRNERAFVDLKGKFDLVFTDGLFEHFTWEDQMRIMANLIVAARKDDGIVITFVPNYLSHWELTRRAMKYMHRLPRVAEKAFTRGRLVKLIRSSGQHIIEIGGVNVLPIRHSPLEWAAQWIGSSLYAVTAPEAARIYSTQSNPNRLGVTRGQ